MPPSTEPPSGTSTPRSFTNQSTSAEELLKSQTVGLVHLSDFRKRRAEVLEQKEREAHDKSLGRFTSATSRTATPSQGDVTDGASTPASLSSDGRPKKKKKGLAKTKLSFGDDEESNDTGEDSTTVKRGKLKVASMNSTEENSGLLGRKIVANPKAHPPPKALTKAAIEAEAEARDVLRKEFLALQEAVKATEIIIPFVFYDGTNIPAGNVKVKKGDPVWLFLDRCRKVGAELGVAGAQSSGRVKRDNRREWARVGVDDLMLVRGDIIVPHHYEFYYFIANKVPSFNDAGGLLFDFSTEAPPEKNDDPLAGSSNEDLEGADADPVLTKVVDRRWYEKNKHIFPASLWREYEQGDDFLSKMKSTRRDAEGNVFFF